MNSDTSLDVDAGACELQFERNRFGERYVHAINRRAFEDAPSDVVFERRLEHDFGAANRLFVVVGSDSGLLANHLAAAHRLGRNSRALIVELDELHALVRPAVPPDPSGTVALCRLGDWRAAFEAMNPAGYVHGGTIELVESLGCVHDHGGRYVSMLRELRAGITQASQALTAEVAIGTFISAQLENACDNVRPAGALRGIGEGRTAIVLGAGPSLDDSIEWLLAEREKLFVISVSRICGKLRRLGVRPDVVVAVDPQDILHDISKPGFLWDDVPLVSAYHVSPRLLQQWRGPTLYLGALLPWPCENDPSRDNVSDCGPTVSHSSIWLAAEWGFERILLSGVDLCYAVGGGTHAGGGVEDLVGFLPTHCGASVETYAGRLAGTSLQLRQGVSELERIGGIVNADGNRLFNLSPDAARVDTVPFLAVDDVELAPEPSRPVPPDEALLARPHLEWLRREHARARYRLGVISRTCDEAVRLFDAMDAASDPARVEARRRRLDRLRRRLEREHGPWLTSLKRDAAGELLAALGPGGLGDADDAERRDWGRRFFAALRRTTARFLALVERGDTRARMRLIELEETPDVEALLAYWDTERTPGRALALRARLAISDPGVATRLATIADAFLVDAEAVRDTGYARSLRRAVLDPSNVRRNIAFLFAQESAADLSSLAERLGALEPPIDAFSAYATGLRAELDDDPARALGHYRDVFDRFGDWCESDDGVPAGLESLLEDVLLRATSCQLKAGDGRAAADSLALLADLSPTYAVRHARLLHLIGERDEALERLEAHVGSRPDDWRALMQMADLYAARGALESADMARRLACEARGGDARTDVAA